MLPFADESVSTSYVAEQGSITLATNRSGASRTFSPADLEITFYPLRVAVSGRRALIIPIQRQWANRMMPFVGRQEELFQGSQDSLFIRSDNVYYCYPKCQDEIESRSSIIFYVSAPMSACIGEAKIRQWALDVPEVLHAIFGGIGVYELPQVRAHVKGVGQHQGQALALRFSHYVPFTSPVPLSDLREILGLSKMTPQGLHPVSIEAFEKIRAKGGLDW
jgi:predicted transcriptional regulator